MYPIYRMKENTTDGTEFCKSEKERDLVIKNETKIGHTHCDYCGKEILAVWDIYNSNKWFPYLGNQSKKPKTYSYSPIIQIMRKFYNAEGKVWNNNLLNVHARIHSKDWGLRCKDGSIKILCNECFQETYNRIQVELNNGSICAISVVESRGETAESVMKELNLNGKIIGKGGKF